MISPIAADGTVSVAWRAFPADGQPVHRAAGSATRTGRATQFGAPGAVAPADPSRLTADDGSVVKVGPDVRAFCKAVCAAPKRFSWKDGTQLIAVHAAAFPLGDGTDASWHVARLANGTFTHLVLATNTLSGPVWTYYPGVIAFHAASAGDYAGRGAGQFLVPLGLAPKTDPRVHIRTATSFDAAKHPTLLLTTYCESTCRLAASTRDARGGRTYSARSAGVTEPFTGSISTRFPTSAKTLRTRITATDSRGRKTRLTVTLRRAAEGQWKIAKR